MNTVAIKKTAADLKKGDKILGNTNWYVVKSLKPSPISGVRCPILEVEDRFGVKKTIDTGSNERMQDHIYEVEEAVIRKEKKKTPKKG